MMKKRILFGLIPLLLCAVWAQKPIASAKTVVASADNILRLHVIAASDSEKDQRDKLAVRDAILPLFSAAESYEDARTFLLNHGRKIQSEAEATLKARGSDNGVQLSLGTETFPDREYGDTVFPAGEYDALCVKIGPAAGHNWWCVLFPPLCIIGAPGETVDLDDVELESTFLDWLSSLF